MIDISKLTPEELQQLNEQLDADKKAKKAKELLERKQYEEIKDAQVRETFGRLNIISTGLAEAKSKMFDAFETVLALKRELYQLDDEKFDAQSSHTFTTSDGKLSVMIGHNVIDRWDETVDVGLGKVNIWLEGLARDEQSAKLVGLIKDLMKPNKAGVLRANRILDLAKRAAEIGDLELIEAVDLIRDAYRPARTSTFIKAKYKDELGRDVWMPLSMSAV
ncbi:MAG: DUF3164 family protein [Salinivirgaceae bacterium]|nr:DUF3164 family protein [Salinivirgaceae bacterium]